MAAVVVGSVVGYLVRGNVTNKQTIHFSKYAVTSNQLGCKAQASATLFVSMFDNTIEAESGRATDVVALNIDTVAKRISFLTAAAVRNGTMDGDKFVIVHEDDRKISAVHVNDMGGVSAVIVIKESGLAIWTKAADVLFTNAQAYILQCS
ncbi:hypothetical protein [Hyphomicrobium sp. CS1BSMeth3]|uniref:hypothetical protein n=1 Tax=Hyphomicrobium sp. CS1BSMeth3 TaxID=1892844 RepID=UPI000930C433|nr:hypothetical protein [Hyphomicrobium sp. CS1BSMeth3]